MMFLAYAAFVARRLLRYLHIFQQEEYAPRHFLKWILDKRAFDRRLSAVLLLVGVVACFVSIPMWIAELLLAGIFGVFCFFEPDPRKSAKKKLAMTSRARRIFVVAYAGCLLMGLYVPLFDGLWAILVVQLIPLSLVLANIFLMPVEALIQRRIMNEASALLARLNPTVVGITGSFGKTSVKHILGHILEMNAPTLFTPGSVNTLMGVSRIIREKLRRETRFFLVEMGAYGVGSIAKLCRLTPPQVGIITALGEAHYERFKTLDTVARAKFELAQAVMAQGAGKIVIHEDVLAQPYARDFVAQNRAHFVLCGTSAHADLVIGGIEQSASGLSVDVRWQGQDYKLFAPLYGIHHGGNMALSFAAAVVLGMPADRAALALRTVPQIKHRLEVKPQPDGTIYIDDGFNSNPRGFAAALELLDRLGAEKGGRRILITPGIVELGAKHDEAHRDLGILAARHSDIALVVQGQRIPTFIEGFAAQKALHRVGSLAEAQKWLRANGKAGDIILIENDLPDTGETKLVL
jgi:UDP-N-acetylmuramoyl-tripeptide--D-alanyl-D-alanine ligase